MATVAVYVSKPPRPVGVSIIAILVMLGGLLALVAGIFVLTGRTGVVDSFGFLNNTTAAGITLAIIGIVSIIVAFGLFGQRIWAWAVVLILELIGLVTALYTTFGTSPANYGALVGVPIPAIVVIYLLLVRSSFVA